MNDDFNEWSTGKAIYKYSACLTILVWHSYSDVNNFKIGILSVVYSNM